MSQGEPQPPEREIVVIGGSAGALDPLMEICRSLPADLPAAVFVVLHSPARARNLLADILGELGPLPAVQAAEGDAIVHGRIYVPAPDRHLVIGRDHVHLSRGPKEGLQRPSINMTFRSAARVYGERVVGVLLSGMLDDGASGLWEITGHNGITVVQDPEEAPYPSMPASALKDVPVDYRLAAHEIGPLLNSLVRGRRVPLQQRNRASGNGERFSGFTCPECHGPLWLNHAGPSEFHCRVGHTFSMKTLLNEQTVLQERKLYEAMLSLEEGAELAEMALPEMAKDRRGALMQEAAQLREHAATIRRMLEERDPATLE